MINDPGCNSSYLSHYKFQTSFTICCAAGSPTDGCASKFFKGRLTAHIKDSYNPYRLHSSFFMKWSLNEKNICELPNVSQQLVVSSLYLITNLYLSLE